MRTMDRASDLPQFDSHVIESRLETVQSLKGLIFEQSETAGEFVSANDCPGPLRV
jgi:hypothetical protein